MLQPDHRLGEFTIVRLLGKGGMGEVYEARQSNPDRPVALKVLAPWLADDEEALDRFWREAAVPARLDHPGIVRIISTGKTDGVAYYAMHLVRGVSLGDLIRHSRQPQPETTDVRTTPDGTPTTDRVVPPSVPAGEPPPTVLAAYRNDRARFAARVGAAAARALAHAHQQGYLHRDIKPSNLMIDHHDQLYLVDFGLTRALDDAGLTQGGTIRGTPWYMSPEQARGDRVDERSDIYSLGVTLYELLTHGRGPFTASRGDSADVLAQVRAGHHLALRSLAPDVPPRLERIIRRTMHPRASRRYPSAAALAEDLERIANQTPSTISRDRPKGGLSRAAVLAGGSALLVVLLVAAGLCWLPSTPRDREPDPDPGAQKRGLLQPAAPVSLREFFERQRPLGAHTPLLRVDGQPILSRVVWGEGKYTPIPGNGMVVVSPKDNKPTLIGLDHPPASFEFAVELRQGDIAEKNANDLGVFFGWREAADPLALTRFFIVQLDERPVQKDAHGRVNLGTSQLLAAKGARGAVTQLLAPLPQGRGMLALKQHAGGRGAWRRLAVRVEGGKIRVTVDDDRADEFEVGWLLRNDKRLKNVSLDPHGVLGVWVRNGQGSFRHATIMPLPEAK